MPPTEQQLLLRPWTDDDAPAVLSAFAADDMTGQAGEPITDLAAAGRWIANWRAAEQAFPFAVVSTGRVVGHVAVSAVDRRHATGWVSYWTTRAVRGQGIGTSATAALAAWAFAELDLFRLELGHRANNPGSCGVARGAGFLVEGLERAKLAYDGVRFDVELHARLRTDPAPAVRHPFTVDHRHA
ncbi:GNAT family N-acetyltransferase [Actinoplanes sp. HUAS TT8]|uniref:GNAT family N-acetyltransferase n=1 Tax=Actinoplanes sp. HUAS TT8 TaxID=3447453 RepID=UPI003F51DD31